MPFRATSRASVIANAIRPSLVPVEFAWPKLPVWPSNGGHVDDTTNPGAMLPGLFFDALSSIRCFPDFPNPFYNADPHAGNLMVQTQNHVPLTLVLLDWTKAGRPSAPLRLALIAHCLYCVTGGERSPDVLTDTIYKQFVQMQKTLLTRFGNPCDLECRSSGITRSPQQRKQR
jgi:hypothetical protein